MSTGLQATARKILMKSCPTWWAGSPDCPKAPCENASPFNHAGRDQDEAFLRGKHAAAAPPSARNHKCLTQAQCHPERSEGPFLRP